MSDLNSLRAWAAGVTGSQPTLSAKSVLVIGLGRVGTALAETLGDLGIEVMAVDIDQGLVDQWADKIPVLAELKAPDDLVGKRLADTDLRAKYQVTVVCVKPDGGSNTHATADTVDGAGDHLVIAGRRA